MSQRNGSAFGSFEDSIALYKAEVVRLEGANEDMKKRYDNLRRQNEQLTDNERTLLDRLAAFEKELGELQSSVSQEQFSERSGGLSYGRSREGNGNRSRDGNDNRSKDSKQSRLQG